MKSFNNDENRFFEMSTFTKGLLAACPMRARRHSGFYHPGLYPSIEYHPLLLLFIVALLLEAFGLWGYSMVMTDMVPFALTGFLALDCAAAWMKTAGAAKLAEINAMKSIADDAGESARAQAMIPRWIPTVRILGVVILIGVSVFKIAGFLMEVSPETPGGTIIGIVTSYVGVAVIHLTATGKFINTTLFRGFYSRELRSVLVASGKGHLTGDIGNVHPRQHQFDSPIELVPCALGHKEKPYHRLELVSSSAKGYVYRLVTFGILSDAQCDSLVGFQSLGEQKTILARNILNCQLAMLDQQPASAPVHQPVVPKDGAANATVNPFSLVSANGSSNRLTPTTVQNHKSPLGQVLALMLIASLSGLTSCGRGGFGLGLKGARKTEEIKMTIGSTGPLTSESGSMPSDIVDLAAPQIPWQVGNKDIIANANAVRLDEPGTAEQPLASTVNGRRNLVDWFTGKGAKSNAILAARRESLKSTKIPEELSKKPTSSDGRDVRAEIDNWAAKEADQGAFVVVVKPAKTIPGDADENRSPSTVGKLAIGGHKVAICDSKSAHASIKEALDGGKTKRLAVVYDNAGILEDTPSGSVIANAEAKSSKAAVSTGAGKTGESAGELGSVTVPVLGAGEKADIELRLTVNPLFAEDLAPKLVIAFAKEQGATAAHHRAPMTVSSNSPSNLTQTVDAKIGGKKIRFRIETKSSGEPITDILGKGDQGSVIVLSGEDGTGLAGAKSAFLAMDAVAFVASPDLQVATLTLPKLMDAFAGRLGWAMHGTEESFDLISGRLPGADKSQFRAGVVIHPHESAVPDAVTRAKNAVGFCSIAALRLRAAPVSISPDEKSNALVPNSITVSSEDYLFTRRLMLTMLPAQTDAAPATRACSDMATRFLNFASTKVAQRCALDAGLVAVGTFKGGDAVGKPAPLQKERAQQTAAPNRETEIQKAPEWERMDIGVRFASASYDLDGFSKENLKRFVDWAKTVPNIRIRLIGHADANGTPKDNMLLGFGRSGAVRDAIIKLSDLKAEVIEIDSRGSNDPVDTNVTPEGRSRNRRVEVWVLHPPVSAKPVAKTNGRMITTPDPTDVFIDSPKPGQQVGMLVPVEGSLDTVALEAGKTLVLGVRPLGTNQIWVQAAPSVTGRTFRGEVYCGRIGPEDDGKSFEIFAWTVAPDSGAVPREGDILDAPLMMARGDICRAGPLLRLKE